MQIKKIKNKWGIAIKRNYKKDTSELTGVTQQ
jgi:hypothetical protein